jgi:predicted nucleic acid-binding protein
MKNLYLNANLLYGECLKLIAKRNIKTSRVKELYEARHHLFTSILTKTEITQRLIREEGVNINFARNIYQEVTKEHNIRQISSLNKKNLLTNTFMDFVAKSNLDFKDALHLEIASKLNLIVVTHDKKFIKNSSKHEDKQKFYSRVVKPEDLLDN